MPVSSGRTLSTSTSRYFILFPLSSLLSSPPPSSPLLSSSTAYFSLFREWKYVPSATLSSTQANCPSSNAEHARTSSTLHACSNGFLHPTSPLVPYAKLTSSLCRLVFFSSKITKIQKEKHGKRRGEREGERGIAF